jgi:TatD DNase family protein
MIDTHCHLYSKELSADIDAVMQRATEVGITACYLPAIDSSTHEDMISLEARYKHMCFAMIGLHPCSVKEDFEHELDIIEKYLTQRTFSAIGETGLDFYWDTSFKAQQYVALERQIQLALTYKLPLVLHARNATKETIDVIRQYKTTGLRGIFHCFGGSIEEAEQIIDCHFLLGIGGVVTYKNSGLQHVIPHISLEHLVLETDAPYLSPVPHRGKRNESSFLVEIGKKIAEFKGVPLSDVVERTTENAMALFSKPSF